MHWAKLIFLSFPGWNAPTAQKALQGARKNRVVIQGVPDTDMPYSDLLDEFVRFCFQTIDAGVTVTIELTLDRNHDGNAFALDQLRARGLDIMGIHSNLFTMQGGYTGAKAFPASILAAHVSEDGDIARGSSGNSLAESTVSSPPRFAAARDSELDSVTAPSR